MNNQAIIKVIERVIEKRLEKFSSEEEAKQRTIILSEFLMKEFINTANEIAGKQLFSYGCINKIKWKDVIVYNREYRDEQTSPEVEEAMLELIEEGEERKHKEGFGEGYESTGEMLSHHGE